MMGDSYVVWRWNVPFLPDECINRNQYKCRNFVRYRLKVRTHFRSGVGSLLVRYRKTTRGDLQGVVSQTETDLLPVGVGQEVFHVCGFTYDDGNSP